MEMTGANFTILATEVAELIEEKNLRLGVACLKIQEKYGLTNVQRKELREYYAEIVAMSVRCRGFKKEE